MAQLTITIPDDQVARVRAAFSVFVVPPGEPSRLATAEEVRLALVKYVKSVVRDYEVVAAKAAVEAEVTDVTPT